MATVLTAASTSRSSVSKWQYSQTSGIATAAPGQPHGQARMERIHCRSLMAQISLARVRACHACGRENPLDARFCNGCGKVLGPVPVPRVRRKTVTVLFCDV